MSKLDNPNSEIKKLGSELYGGVVQIIENARKRTAFFLNSETTLMYWSVGNYINKNLKTTDQMQYGSKILATLSQLLTTNLGKGFTYTALTRMCKVAERFDEKNIATLSQQLSWSHLIELAAIDNNLKREF